MARPSIRDFFANFGSYDAPVAEKLKLAMANNLKKARTGSECCGNHGQPGC